MQVQFTSTATGARAATLSIGSTDPNSPLGIALTGTGTVPPGFTLTVAGGSAAAATVSSGSTAAFPLLLTTQGGYSGMVALSCKALEPAPHATCAVAQAQLLLSAAPVNTSASLATLSGINGAFLSPLGLLCFGRLLRTRRRTQAFLHSRVLLPLSLCLLCFFATSTGCGGRSGNSGSPYTPPGVYRYQVTARAGAGSPLSSAVTLTITVH